jgi:hypothetical protein
MPTRHQPTPNHRQRFECPHVINQRPTIVSVFEFPHVVYNMSEN